jgi:hypothetical protein
VSGSNLSRRDFLATLGLALAGVACGGGGGTSKRSPGLGTIDSLKRGATQLSLFGSADVETPLNPGRNRFAFALVTSNGGVVTEGGPQVYVAPSPSTTPRGPFPARWYPFTAYEKTGDRSPKTPIPGTYVAEIDVPQPGTFLVLAVVANGGQRQAGLARLAVQTKPVIAAVGSRAISTRTPVATTEAGRRQICTREPPDEMHAVSLDDALTNGKPTVVSFATPLLCESRMCGPVVDEQILVFERHGPARANFIHVEEFLPGEDLKPPVASLETRSPAFKAWGFTSEPWVLVIDAKGIIQARFGPGATTAPEIEAALTPLL